MKDKPQYKVEYFADSNKYFVMKKHKARTLVSGTHWYSADIWEDTYYYSKITVYLKECILDCTGYELAYDTLTEAMTVCDRMMAGNTSYYPHDYKPVKE